MYKKIIMVLQKLNKLDTSYLYSCRYSKQGLASTANFVYKGYEFRIKCSGYSGYCFGIKVGDNDYIEYNSSKLEEYNTKEFKLLCSDMLLKIQELDTEVGRVLDSILKELGEL